MEVSLKPLFINYLINLFINSIAIKFFIIISILISKNAKEELIMEKENHIIINEKEEKDLEFKKLLNRENKDSKQEIKSFKAMD